MKICFATVIYREARQFLDEYLESLNAQTDKDFDLLLINDNYPKEELEALPLPTGTIVCDRYADKLSIGALRIELIKEAKLRGYELMILGDADDTFENTRVEQLKKAYELDKNYAFYYNELVTDKGSLVFDYIPEIIRNVRPIAQGNFLGMSTTAINMTKLSLEYIESLKRGICNIFDWYLYSRLLMDIGPGKFVEAAATIYRLHESNQVGVSVDVEREIRVKREHYGRLLEYEYFSKLKNLLETTNIESIDTSSTNHGYWWSNIYLEENYEI